jgi:anti-sigma factor RsiW
MDHPRDIQLIERCGEGLSAGARAEIDAHLAVCDDCAERYRQTRATWQALGEWSAEPELGDLADRVCQKIADGDSDPPPVYRMHDWVWPVTRVAASVAAAVLLGYAAGLAVRPAPSVIVMTGEPDPQQAAAELYLDVLADDSPSGLVPVILPPAPPEEEA